MNQQPNYQEKLLALKAKIKLKFKTLRHFGISANIEYAELSKFFAQRMAHDKADLFWREIESALRNVNCIPNEKEITKAERDEIRAKIVVNYKSIDRFITDNPGFSKSFISNVITGRRIRKDERFDMLINAVNSLTLTPQELR